MFACGRGPAISDVGSAEARDVCVVDRLATAEDRRPQKFPVDNGSISATQLTRALQAFVDRVTLHWADSPGGSFRC